MTILDTSVAIDRIRSRKPIDEDITAVTFVEYPRIVYYNHFYGKVIFPVRIDFKMAHTLQLVLLKMGAPQAFADLLVASIAINRKEKLITYYNDFLLIKGAAKEIGHILNLEIPE